MSPRENKLSNYKYICQLYIFFYLFESAVHVEFPPIKMIGIEGKIIIFSTVAGVRQNVAATFGESKKDVSENKKYFCNTSSSLANTTKKAKSTLWTSSESADFYNNQNMEIFTFILWIFSKLQALKVHRRWV